MWKGVPCHEGALGNSNFLGLKIEKENSEKKIEADKSKEK